MHFYSPSGYSGTNGPDIKNKSLASRDIRFPPILFHFNSYVVKSLLVMKLDCNLTLLHYYHKNGEKIAKSIALISAVSYPISKEDSASRQP